MPALAFEAWFDEDDATVRDDDADEFDKLILTLELEFKWAEPFASLTLFEASRL